VVVVREEEGEGSVAEEGRRNSGGGLRISWWSRRGRGGAVAGTYQGREKHLVGAAWKKGGEEGRWAVCSDFPTFVMLQFLKPRYIFRSNKALKPSKSLFFMQNWIVVINSLICFIKIFIVVYGFSYKHFRNPLKDGSDLIYNEFPLHNTL